MVLQLREIYSPDDFPKPTRYDKARFIVVLQGNVTLEFDAGKGDISVDIDYYHTNQLFRGIGWCYMVWVVHDEDFLDVNLKKGKNTILVKVENNIGEWGLVLRIVDPKNELKY